MLSRRHASATTGVRGLLITVLGDYVRPGGRAVPTSAFIDVLGRLGVEAPACRQTLQRAAADGWLLPERDGRYTWWRLSPPFAHFLELGTERIFGFSATQPDWDRRWLLLLARVPETNRPARHLLRTRLGWLGFGSPAPGVWVSTRTDRAKPAEIVLDEAGVRETAQIFLAEHVGGGELPDLVRQAWDLAGIEREYEQFHSTFARQPAADPLVRLTRLVHEWRRLPLVDPALPENLLPQPWAGTRAAQLFRQQHARWLPAATAEWERISREAR